MTIKMIALDLDNTLLDSHKHISPRNERVLRRLHEQGIKVVLCTGRPINAIWPLIEQLGLTEDDDCTINFNGGLVLQNTTKKFLFKQGMSYDNIHLVYNYCQQNHYPLNILDFESVYEMTDLEKSGYSSFIHHIKYHHMPFSYLPQDKEFSKLIICTKEERVDQAEKNVPDEVRKVFTVTRSQPYVLEFLPPQVDKAVGMKKLLDHYGWNFKNVMSFGDGDNDLGMTTAVANGGGIAVAMSNGVQAVRKAATHVTKSNDEDGVATYLEQYFATLL